MVGSTTDVPHDDKRNWHERRGNWRDVHWLVGRKDLKLDACAYLTFPGRLRGAWYRPAMLTEGERERDD